MKRIILLLVSVGMLVCAGNTKAADAKFGDSASALVSAGISDTTTWVKKIANPIGAGVVGVLDSAIVKFCGNTTAGDKQWAVVYYNGVMGPNAGKPGTRVAVSQTYATTVGTSNNVETYTVTFNGETWDGGTDSLWIGGFVQPITNSKWASTDSATGYAMYGVGWQWKIGYMTTDASVQLEPPGSSFSWATLGTYLAANNSNIPWIQIWYHTAGAHTPKIDLVPDSLGFAATIAGSNPAAQTLGVLDTAAGSGPMTWTLTYDSSQWMSVTPTSGSMSDTVTVTLSMPPEWVDSDAGTHIDTIWVACATADSTPMPMQVVFVVSASNTPIIDVSPTSLSFSRPLGLGASASKSLSVSNVGMGTMVWTIEHDSTWIIPVVPGDDSTGTGDLVVWWYVNPGSNPVGTYIDTLHVTCATASNSPYNIPVTMEVTQAARKLMIRKNNP